VTGIVRYGWAASPVGSVFVARTARGLAAVSFASDANPEGALTAFRRAWPASVFERDDAMAEYVGARVFALGARASAIGIPLDVVAKPFRERVWAVVCAIPRGETRTYGEVAQALGSPSSVRAVGQAVGANPVAVVVPCHRVIAANGGLGGYRWGVERKRALLDWEGVRFPSEDEFEDAQR
jgi:O-6-methylguanine DNA methyltransferase